MVKWLAEMRWSLAGGASTTIKMSLVLEPMNRQSKSCIKALTPLSVFRQV